MWIVLVLTGLVIVISYVFYALRQTSGSEFAGNSLDDFILTKGGSVVYEWTLALKFLCKNAIQICTKREGWEESRTPWN